MDFAADMKTDDFFSNTNGRDSTLSSNQEIYSKKRQVA